MLFEFEEVAALATGLPSTEQLERDAARDLLIQQTIDMQGRLERCGKDMSVTQRRNIIAIGNLTATAQQQEQSFKKCRFLPVVAKADRASWLRELEYFLKNHPRGKFARYGVITCGGRVPFDAHFAAASSERIATIQKNIRRWINDSRENFGIDVLLKTLESALNPLSAHWHFNVVYIPERRLQRDVFERWLSWSKNRLGRVCWKDCGRIRNLREVVKYVCKTQGQDSLETISDSAFSDMYDVMFKRSTIEAHGSFAAFRKDMAQNSKKVVWLRKKNAPPRLALMRKQIRPTATKTDMAPDPTRENVVLGRQLPRTCGQPVLEPVTLVQNYTANPTTEAGKAGLAILNEHMREARLWGAKNGTVFNVHTTPASVQAVGGLCEMRLPALSAGADSVAGVSACDNAQRRTIPPVPPIKRPVVIPPVPPIRPRPVVIPPIPPITTAQAPAPRPPRFRRAVYVSNKRIPLVQPLPLPTQPTPAQRAAWERWEREQRALAPIPPIKRQTHTQPR